MTALWEKADLIVTGSRGLSREEKEFTVVSISHRIASHLTQMNCSAHVPW